MAEVWVLETGAYSDRFVTGVFSSLDRAREYADGRITVTCIRKNPHHAHGWSEPTNGSTFHRCREVDITRYLVDEVPQ